MVLCTKVCYKDIALSTPVQGYKLSREDRGPFSWAPVEDHHTSLTSQGVQHRFFGGDHPSSYHHLHPPGLKFGEQTETIVSLCCFKAWIIHLCFQLAISQCILGLGCFPHGKKGFSAWLLLSTVFRGKHEEHL